MNYERRGDGWMAHGSNSKHAFHSSSNAARRICFIFKERKKKTHNI